MGGGFCLEWIEGIWERGLKTFRIENYSKKLDGEGVQRVTQNKLKRYGPDWQRQTGHRSHR